MSKKKKKSYGKMVAAILGGVALFALVAVYVGMSVFFSSHFPYNTKINGVDCSGKTVEDVKSLVSAEMDGYRMELLERGNKTEVIRGIDIGLKPEFDGSLERELSKRNGFAWPASLFRETEIELTTMVQYDETLLEMAFSNLDCRKEGNVTHPRSASISSYMEGTGYEIIPEEEGNEVVDGRLMEAMKDALLNLRKTVSLEEEQCYAQPGIRSDDAGLNETLQQLNKCATASITYEIGSRTETLDGVTIHNWVHLGEDGQVDVDKAAIAEYVEGLAEKYDTAGGSRTLNTSYGSTVTVSPNQYGWRIDKEGEEAALLSDIQAGGDVSREPVYAQRAKSRDGQDHGGTFVEVNLTAQHLYFYKNGNLVLESDFVSGDLALGRGTHCGAYSVAYKQKDAVLRGETYRTPVSFWMPFNGGEGLHDATWRSEFGGDIYKTDGSHGCVNLPYSVAQQIFENIEAGDAVFVYELPGTEPLDSAERTAASDTMALIDAIGVVTADSYGAIQAARFAYDALSEVAKGYVTNYDVLVAAEAAYANLTMSQIPGAQPPANQGTQQSGEQGTQQSGEQGTQQSGEQGTQQSGAQGTQQGTDAEQAAQAEAAPVVEAINAIGEVTLESEGAIVAARDSYNALSDLAKQYVSNIATLDAAEQALAGLKAGQ